MTASLEDRADHWQIEGVPYRGNIEAVDLSKTLLPARTQDEHARHAAQARESNGFHAADAPLYQGVFAAVFRNNDPGQQQAREQIKEFLKRSFFDHWLMTLTRIMYAQVGQDKVIHNVGLPEQYEIKEEMVGLNEWVKDAANKAPYKALLGTDDTAEIQAVYQWITSKNLRLYRMNNKPTQDEVRVAGFGAGGGGAGLVCDGGPRYSGSHGGGSAALGVRLSAEGAQKIFEKKITTPKEEVSLVEKIVTFSKPYIAERLHTEYEQEIRQRFPQ